MSDDRYNKGPHQRRPHTQGGQPQQGDDGEKTQLVDLDALRSGGDGPQFAPPPTIDSAPPPNMEPEPPPTVDSSPPPMMGHSGPGDEFEEKTELFEMPPVGGPSGKGGITSSAPDYGSSSFGHNPPSYGSAPQQPDMPPPSVGSGTGSSPPSGPGAGQFSSLHTNGPAAGGSSSTEPVSSGSSGPQVIIPSDDDAGHDGATAFINVSDFAEQKAHFTPHQEEAGYDGNTQFVDINALQAGAGAPPPPAFGSNVDPIDRDDDLHRGYQFGPNDIQRGDVTLIYAKNALGKAVVLKRVWDGEPHTMSAPLRERIAELHELQHRHLVSMNGMFVSDSGMWAELDAPRGKRLTELIEQNGAIDPDLVLQWIDPIADVLETVHANQLAYANLTTDAVWIDDDGNVLVEPFDMLRLEDRGNLGVFGPPEMNAPPEQRELSPASDVYSLAAVVGAAITGLPFHPQKLQEREDLKLAKKLLPALAADPSERPATTGAFRGSLGGGINLAELDIKVVGAAVFGVLILGVGLLAILGGDSSSDPPAEDMHAQAEAPDQLDAPPPSSNGDETDPGSDESAGVDDATVDLPTTVHSDDRLSIITSFEHNPPADAVQRATDRQLDEWRDEARQYIARAEDESSQREQLDYYSSALELLTQVIRRQSDPTDDDLETWQRVYQQEVIQEELKTIIETLDEAVSEGRIGSANRRYHRLSRFDPFADAENFMRTYHSAKIVHLGSDGDDDDD